MLPTLPTPPIPPIPSNSPTPSTSGPSRDRKDRRSGFRRRATAPVVAGGLALVAGALRGGPAPAAAQATLQGTPWMAIFCADASGRLLPVTLGVEITATFQAGQVTGSAGCNQYMAGYQLAQDTAGIMRISPAASPSASALIRRA